MIAALGLCLFFFVFTSRNSGSHPRDLQKERVHDSPREERLRATIKEPPGQWDPIQDKFKNQQKSGAGDVVGLDEQLDAIGKGSLHLPEDGIKRKTPKKGEQNMAVGNRKEDIGPGVVSEKPATAGDESGGAVSIQKEEVVSKEYDPAEGIMLWSAF